MTEVLLDVADAIATVTLNRPHRLNAIGGSLLADLHAALQEASARPDVRAVVLTGAGRAFCSGDDLKEFALQTAGPEAIERHVSAIQRITRDLMLVEKPVVGAVRGYAVGGGFEWMLNCDLVVAGDDLVAFLPEMGWGQFVTGALTHLLPLAVGHQRAMELMLLGEHQNAARLERLGLVNKVVPPDRVLEEAHAMARVIAGKSAASVGALKRLVAQELSGAVERALALEAREAIAAFGRQDAAERAGGFGSRDRGA